MKKSLFTTLLTLPILASAQVLGPEQSSQQPMFNKTFERLHSSAKIDCSYYESRYLPSGNVAKVTSISQDYSLTDKTVSTHYKVGEADLNIEISTGGMNGIVTYNFNGLEIPATLSKYNFIWFDNLNLTSEQNEVINNFRLRDLQCSLDIAKEETFEIENKELHISMHPYTAYDMDGESNPIAEKYINDTSLPQLLLLDDIRAKRKAATLNFNEFMRLGHIPHDTEIRYLSLPKISIPKDIPTRVAGAGHLKFKLTQKEHEITYTGGNYNFCILNNNRRMIHALLNSPVTNVLKINYIMDGTVLQKSSFVPGLKPKKKYIKYTNLLSTVLANMSRSNGVMEQFLNSHYNDFKTGILNYRKQHYGTMKVIRQGIGTDRVEVLQGTGQGDYTIIFNYI